MNEAFWALGGALGGALLAGGLSLVGVRLTLRHTEARDEQARREAHRAYVQDKRRLAYSGFIAAVLDAEQELDRQDDVGRPVPLRVADIQSLQAKIVQAQGSMLMFGSGPAVRASSRSLGEMIGALRGVSGSTGHRDGLSDLVAIARREFRGDFIDD
jgi:hypothetical protein